jgi:sarcosine oxidase subunit gamma
MDGQVARPPRRSFIYRELEAAGAHFAAVGDAEVAVRYAGDGEAQALSSLGLADLSPLPRTGFKGDGVAGWLAAQGLEIGEDSNRATRQADGILAARLAPGEVLVLDGLAGGAATCERLDAAWTPDAGAFWPVPRRDGAFWFLVTGEHAATMFAKLCGVDLRPAKFANHTIAQTSVARTNAIVVRDDLGSVPAFHLLGDSASARYMWRCLADAADEFGGHPVGLEAVRALIR